MTDLSKMSNEDLIVNYKRAVCNINWRDKANLENYRVLTEELMRRLAEREWFLKEIEIHKNLDLMIKKYEGLVNTKLTITNNTDKDVSIIIEEIE